MFVNLFVREDNNEEDHLIRKFFDSSYIKETKSPKDRKDDLAVEYLYVRLPKENYPTFWYKPKNKTDILVNTLISVTEDLDSDIDLKLDSLITDQFLAAMLLDKESEDEDIEPDTITLNSSKNLLLHIDNQIINYLSSLILVYGMNTKIQGSGEDDEEYYSASRCLASTVTELVNHLLSIRIDLIKEIKRKDSTLDIDEIANKVRNHFVDLDEDLEEE